MHIHTLYTYTRFALGFYPKRKYPAGNTPPPPPFMCVASPTVHSKFHSPAFLPPSLPPSLPPEESSRALPILQYLYFSMLKPRYIINYINKLRSPVISRTYELPVLLAHQVSLSITYTLQCDENNDIEKRNVDKRVNDENSYCLQVSFIC